MMSSTLARVASETSYIPWMTSIGLFVFGVFFLGLVFWVRHAKNQSRFETLRNLPLEENENE